MKWNKTDKDLPDRDPNKRRSTVPCLVIRNNQIRILVFNHEDHCWDEESGDDYECDVMQVSHWIALSSLPKPDESPSSDPAEIELPFMDAREWSDADKEKLVEETMRLSAAPIMNTMAMLGINNLMRCEVVNHATGDEYIFSFQRKETKPDPAEVLVKAIDTVIHKVAGINDSVTNDVCFILTEARDQYEQLKQQ